MDLREPNAAGQSRSEIPPASSAADDERELVASILRKDRKAAAQFVAAHIDAVYTYARHRLAPRADLVDDVVQDVFLAALNGLAAFQGQSSLRTWLIAIARHKIEDVYRQRLRLSNGGRRGLCRRKSLVGDDVPRRTNRYGAGAREGSPTSSRNARTIRADPVVAVLGTAKHPRDGGRDRDDREERGADARAGARAIQRALVEGVVRCQTIAGSNGWPKRPAT